VPAGRIERGATERLVRVTGRIVDPAAFADIPVAVRNGTPVRISDVAVVIDGAENRRTGAEISDQSGTASAVSLEVLKISGANTVQVADAVRATVAELETQLPRDIEMTVIRDDSRRIRESLADVKLSIVLGAVLTVMIIYLFLNSWRSTVITGLTLPVSIISAFFIMWVFNFTVNTMTLLALSLAIGLLIDDAIVVRENIVRHLEMGKSHDLAAKEGTDEIGLAVMATTFAVVAVFVPVAFMGGIIGKIFFQFGVTVTFAVLVSLFVSFTLDPMLSSVWADPEVEHAVNGGEHQAAQRRKANFIRRFAFAFNDWFERVADRYPSWLRWALGHRLTVLAVAASTIIASFLILPKLGFTWMPDVNGDEFSVGYRTPPGSTLDYSLDKGREIAAFLQKQPETDFTYLSVGGGFRGTPNQGQIFVALKPGHKRSLFEIQNDLRGKLRGIAGVRPNIQGPRSIFGGRGQPIQVYMQGPESSRLKVVANRALDAMRAVPGVAEPNSSEDGDIPQLDVRIDRQEAWRAGLGVGSVASTLQPLFTGQRATTWEDPQGFSHDVVVVFPDSLRSSAADVSQLPIASTFMGPNGIRTRGRGSAADRTSAARAAGHAVQRCDPGLRDGRRGEQREGRH
jgi:hydrophobic/amphiphilic exporter-1 (mainly G- bacteria), HAE1 family